MTNATTSPAGVAELKAMVEQLQERLDDLENRMTERHPPGEVSDEVLMAISAACAAYLGKRAVIKQIHRRRPRNWAAQGRRAVQTSHNVY